MSILIGLILLLPGVAPTAAAAQVPSIVEGAVPPTSTHTVTPAETATVEYTAAPPATVPAGSPEPQPSESGTAEEVSPGINLGGLETILQTVEDVVPARTPAPTATPDALAEAISNIVQETGLSGRTLLSLRYADWINLAVSLLYVVVAYLIGTWLIRWLLPRLVQRTATTLDDELLQTSGSIVRWLAVVLIVRVSTNRLSFVNAEAKAWLTDIYFFLGLILALLIVWRLVRLAARQAEERARGTDRRKETESLIALSVWAARLVVIVLALSLTLSYFGANITGLAVFLAIIGLALSLAGRDIVSDMISGAIILIDRPYRNGDRIDLPSIESWGNVVDIGMRSTRILTLDNRMMIVPNSQISKDQIVNYSYPDPSYNDIVDIAVAYDNDADRVGQLLVDTLRSVEGIQQERDIDVLLIEFTENHMLFKVGWWIATYDDFFVVRDRANRAIVQALRDAGVVLPYRRSSVHLDGDSRWPASLEPQRIVGDGESAGKMYEHERRQS
jgi:small-conductance mechanosensitive channel